MYIPLSFALLTFFGSDAKIKNDLIIFLRMNAIGNRVAMFALSDVRRFKKWRFFSISFHVFEMILASFLS